MTRRQLAMIPRLCERVPDEVREGTASCALVACRCFEAGACVLVIADQNPDGMNLQAIGDVLGCTRENVRLIEAKALRKLNAAPALRACPELADLAPEGAAPASCSATSSRRRPPAYTSPEQRPAAYYGLPLEYEPEAP